MNTVLITGANGFIANHAARAVHGRGYELVLLDQTFDPERKQFWSGHGVRLIERDLRDLEPLEADAVIHGAALTAEPAELDLTAEAYLKKSLAINLRAQPLPEVAA